MTKCLILIENDALCKPGILHSSENQSSENQSSENQSSENQISEIQKIRKIQSSEM